MTEPHAETLRRAIEVFRGLAKRSLPGGREDNGLNALADWFETVIDLHGPIVTLDHPWGCQWCNDEDWPCADTRHALNVARAYLGEN